MGAVTVIGLDEPITTDSVGLVHLTAQNALGTRSSPALKIFS